jgi:hypothetical protein
MEIPEKSGLRWMECLRLRVQENRWKNTKTGEQGRHHIDESLIPARPEFAARLMDYEAIAEVSRPIRISGHDKLLYGTEPAQTKGLVAALSRESTASYTDRKSKSRILCASIYLLLERA